MQVPCRRRARPGPAASARARASVRLDGRGVQFEACLAIHAPGWIGGFGDDDRAVAAVIGGLNVGDPRPPADRAAAASGRCLVAPTGAESRVGYGASARWSRSRVRAILAAWRAR